MANKMKPVQKKILLNPQSIAHAFCDGMIEKSLNPENKKMWRNIEINLRKTLETYGAQMLMSGARQVLDAVYTEDVEKLKKNIDLLINKYGMPVVKSGQKPIIHKV